MAFTIFAPDLTLIFYMFATYLPTANLCKSIFASQFEKGNSPNASQFPCLLLPVLFVYIERGSSIACYEMSRGNEHK